MEYRSTGKTVFSAKYRLIWVPKYRRRVLITGVGQRLKGIIGGVVEELGGMMIEQEVMSDHVHLLAEIPPNVALSAVMHVLKGGSSRLLRQEFPGLRRMRLLWTWVWFVSTVGGAPAR